MARGRIPKPDAINEKRGDPGNRRRYQTSVKGPEGAPTPPDYLSPAAADEWKLIVVELSDMGVLSRVDRASLVTYCEAWARYRQAQAMLLESGPITRDGKYSPLNRIIVDNLSIVTKYLLEFGCTPAGRARMRFKKEKPKEKSKVSAVLKIAGVG